MQGNASVSLDIVEE